MTFSFVSSIRKAGKQLVLNIPKALHEKILDNGEEPYSCMVQLELLYPKNRENID